MQNNANNTQNKCDTQRKQCFEAKHKTKQQNKNPNETKDDTAHKSIILKIWKQITNIPLK